MNSDWRDSLALTSVGSEVLQLTVGTLAPGLAVRFVSHGGSLGWSDHSDRWALDATGGTAGEALAMLAYGLENQPMLLKGARRRAEWNARIAMAEVASTQAAGRAEQHRWRRLTQGALHPLFDSAALPKPARASLVHLTERVVRPDNGVVLLITNAKPQTAAPAVKQTQLSSWRGRRISEVPVALQWSPPLSRSVSVFDDSVSTAQGEIRLACHVASRGLELALVEDLLDQRLNDALRHTLGATYGVHVHSVDQPHGLTLNITTKVGMEQVGVAVKSLLATLDGLASGELADTSLARTKLSYARRSVTKWQTVPELADWLARLHAAGMQPDVEYDFAQALHEVSREDLVAVLAPCTGFEAVTVVGEATAVKAGLDEAGVVHTSP